MTRRKLRSELALSRRTLLRGVVGGTLVALGVPTLEAMLDDHGEALANGEPLPRRLVTWLWGNGCRLEHWVPAEQGPGFSASAELQPLFDAGLADDIRVLSGFRNPVAGRRGHHDGMAGLFSGHPFINIDPMGAPYASKFGGPSIDQVAADIIAGDSYYKSLQVGVSKRHLTNQGPTLETMSHRGPDQPLLAIRDPALVYNKLFGALQSGEPADVLRASALDAVMQDVQRLKQRVSANDQHRLDAHMESVFQLQKQIAVIPGSCDLPSKPTVEMYKPDGAEPLWEINQVMSQMVALALSCDLSRVISYMFTGASGGTQFDMLPPSAFPEYPNAKDYSHADHHSVSHNNNDYEKFFIHRSVVVSMENLAYLLQLLRDTAEGDGTLLDHCCVLAGSDVTEAVVHSENDFPLIVAGHAGGRLRKNVGHYRSPNAETLSNVGLACLKAVAPDPDSVTDYGSDVGSFKGYTTTPASILLA